MKKKYYELTFTYNLFSVILPTDKYRYIYAKGAYSLLPVVVLYDDAINIDAKRTEVHQEEG